MTGRRPTAAPAPPKSDPEPFDVCGPLPTGVTLLEASAGTGKTFTIAGLAARYVAQGMSLDNLLIVTFTRMATGELRERVRERLAGAAEGLSAALAGEVPDPDDDVLCVLASGSRQEVELRQWRLAKAIANFDAATIETTHGFCMQVLSGLGTAGDVEQDVTLIEDAGDLLEEVVDDLYVRRFWASADDLRITRSEALRIGKEVLAHAAAAIVPPKTEERSVSALRRRLAGAVLREIEQRKRTMQVLTYDDVLIRLRDTLADEARGPAACMRLRERYKVVLVDEFQDTDPVQWDIMRRAFGSGGSTLVLIGDPKQAIYAFRGADVFAYLQAADEAATRATLSVNWRSDGDVIAAYDALFGDSQLGHEGIVYRSVVAAGANMTPRLKGAPSQAALRVRMVHRGDGLTPLTYNNFISAPLARPLIASDLASDVVALLSSGAEIVERSRDGTETACLPVRPGHLAVLVRTHNEAAIVRDALEERSVPAVIGGGGSVFATPAAADWLRLLDAIERPTSRDRAASVALTSFVGWAPVKVATAGDEEWEDLHWSVHRWATVLRRRGVAALLENLTVTRQIPRRVLARPAGERFLTDLRHVGQLLHAAAVSEVLGSSALSAWLGRRIAEANADVNNEDRSRRLESDAEAVQVLTIHRAKGLEFPIVYCPFMWSGWFPKNPVPVYHDPDNDDVLTIDVGIVDDANHPPAPSQQLAQIEQRGEDLRLLYVALTRAKHQAVLWWAGTRDTKDSPLGRLLFAVGGDGFVAASGTSTATDAEVADKLAALGGDISLERVGTSAAGAWEDRPPPPPELEADSFDRSLDQAWRRASYSSITQASHDQTVASEPEQGATSDEDVTVADVGDEALPGLAPGSAGGLGAGGGAGAASGGPSAPPADSWQSLPLLLGDMAGGTRVGTLIHSVMEATDFAAPDLPGELRTALYAELAWQHLDLGDRQSVVDGLRTAIETPLGPSVGGVRLRDIERRDRLDEMTFELPLLGGDVPRGALSVIDIADLLEESLPPHDPVAGYAKRLADPSIDATLRGYLTGSLDLVFRLPGERFVVADYKTNRLAPVGEPLTAWNYRSAAVTAQMEAAHYPLQALLYLVALHRYLRWRIKGYDPEDNLAGALYLFLRGMSSPAFPERDGQPCGVWSWQPPAGLVVALSDLFDLGRGSR